MSRSKQQKSGGLRTSFAEWKGEECIRPIEMMVRAMVGFLGEAGLDWTREGTVEYATYLWTATICYDKLVGWGKEGKVNPARFISFCERFQNLIEEYHTDNTAFIRDLAESFVNDLLPDWLERATRADAGNC